MQPSVCWSGVSIGLKSVSIAKNKKTELIFNEIKRGSTSNFNFSKSTYFSVFSTFKVARNPDSSWNSQSKVDSVKSKRQ
jgi:hypothetical protein